MRRLLLFFLPLLCLTTLRAQSVRWDPPGGTLPAAQVTQLNLVFDQCEPTGDIALPTIPGLQTGSPGRAESSSFRFENGQATTSRTITLTYPVRAATGSPAIQIPAFDVDTKQGRLHVPPAIFTVGPATVGNNNAGGIAPAASVSLDTVAQSRFTPPADAVWAGEVFPFYYRLNIARRYYNNLGSAAPEWDSAPLSVEDWAKPELTETTQAGEQRVVITYRTRAYVKSPGTVALKPASQLVNLATGTTQGFGLFGPQRTLEQFSITSQPAALTVKPLPTPAPAAFAGAVGQFTLDSKVVPATVAVGEPITWTLALAGTGNWPDIAALPSRSVSRDFRIVSPQAKRTPAADKLFDATLAEDIVLIPTKPGTYTLGPVTLACFDPNTGQYKNLTTEKFTVTVTGPAGTAGTTGPNFTLGNPTNNGTADSANPQSALPTPQSPPTPNGLPRDPLPPAATVAAPLSARAFIFWLLTPVSCLLPFWLALAARRAAQTDPLRPQREARRRLAALLAEFPSAPSGSVLHPSPFTLRLSTWRQNTALLFGNTHAEPTAAVVFNLPGVGGVSPPRISKSRGQGTPPTTATTPSDWPALWRDTDRALYGEKISLPSDWLPRAQAALEAKRLPLFNPLRLFLPSNLFPRASANTSATPPVSAEPAPTPATAPLAANATTTLTLLLLLLSLFTLHPSLFAAAENPKSTIQNPKSAAVAYGGGDFPAAEKSWRETLASAPTDWSAHHNLSLALAQQSRWDESAGHALAAFVQQPQNPAARWQLDLALKNAGWLPDAAQPLLRPGPVADLAARASPAEWQRLALFAALLAAAALALLLWHAYAPRARWPKLVALTALLAALVLGSAAAVSLHLYGPLADARAVLVWRRGTLRSIPTEADTAQKTTPLSPGLVAVADKTFLGWTRLAFPNGQTGWVRKEELVPLYR